MKPEIGETLYKVRVPGHKRNRQIGLLINIDDHSRRHMFSEVPIYDPHKRHLPHMAIFTKGDLELVG